MAGQLYQGRHTPLVVDFLEHVKAIQISGEVAEWLLAALKEFEVKRRSECDQRLARYQEKQRTIQARIDAAYDDKLAGRITEESWVRRSNGWQEELAGPCKRP